MPGPTVTWMRHIFSLRCGVSVNVRASAEVLWNLLTDANGFPRWNSTISCVESEIREGEHIRVSVPGSDRRFMPKVSDVVPNASMTWTGGFAPLFKGVRTFTLHRRNDGSTDFTMVERFSGVLLPLVRGSLPDFGAIFEQYASDLQREAERGAR